MQVFSSHVAPGFVDGIRDWRVVTPLDYERDFGLPRATRRHSRAAPSPPLAGKDRELTRYETPVEGLFLTGAGTFPGAGVWGASGRNTATVVLGQRRGRLGQAHPGPGKDLLGQDVELLLHLLGGQSR